MARTRRALAAPSPRRWRLSTASRTFRVVHRLTVILSLRRIRDPSARPDELRILRLRSQARFAQDDISLRRMRDPSARRDELRILRLRSQARFAQDDTALPIGFETFEIHHLARPRRREWK